MNATKPPVIPDSLHPLLGFLSALYAALHKPEPSKALERELPKYVEPHQMDTTWTLLSKAEQHLLCEATAAAVRCLDPESTKPLIKVLRDYAQAHQPGFVHGLALGHKPKRRSWLADARALLGQLLQPDMQEPKIVPDDAARESLPLNQSSRIRFHGACGQVTGSMTELELNVNGRALRVLFDCGLTQGAAIDGASTPLALPATLDASALHVVFLTHAHADHCGLLPLLYKAGYQGCVVCSEPTKALTLAALKDSAKNSAALTSDDIEQIVWWTHKISPYEDFFPIAQDVFLRTTRSSHLLGATGFALNWGPNAKANPCVCISGDVGPHMEKGDGLGGLLPRNMPFHPPKQAQRATLILESTYGDRHDLPPTVEARRAELLAILEAMDRDAGLLLIPTFAIGRTQEVLFDLEVLRREHPDTLADLAVFTSGSGLSHEASEIYAHHVVRSQYHHKRKGGPETRVSWGHRSAFERLGHSLETPQGQDAAAALLRQAFGLQKGRVQTLKGLATLEDGPGRRVVVASSGMGDHGLMHEAIRRFIQQPATAVAIVGWAAPYTVCGKLLRFAQVGRDGVLCSAPVALWEGGPSTHDVQATIFKLDGYGGHASWPALMRQIWPQEQLQLKGHQAYDRVFLVHGEERARRALAKTIGDQDDAPSVTLPSAGVWYDLDAQDDRDVQELIQAAYGSFGELERLDRRAAAHLLQRLMQTHDAASLP